MLDYSYVDRSSPESSSFAPAIYNNLSDTHAHLMRMFKAVSGEPRRLTMDTPQSDEACELLHKRLIELWPGH